MNCEFIKMNGEIINSYLLKDINIVKILNKFNKFYNNEYYKIYYDNIIVCSILQNKIIIYCNNDIFINNNIITLTVINIILDDNEINILNNILYNNINTFNYKDINDIHFILHIIDKYNYIYNITNIIINLNDDIKNKLLNDINILKIALNINGEIIQFTNYKNNLEYINIAIENTGYILKFLSEDMKNNRDIVLKAVNTNGYSLVYASKNFYNDKENSLVIKSRLGQYHPSTSTTSRLVLTSDTGLGGT